MHPPKLTVGTRVKHATDDKLNEGVIVGVNLPYSGDNPILKKHIADRIFSVHWSCGVRGIYSSTQINRTEFKNRDIVKEIEKVIKLEITENENAQEN